MALWTKASRATFHVLTFKNAMKVLTAAQMREVDRLSTEQFGIPSLVLMENAGSGVVREMERYFGNLQRFRVAVLCGKGNNGGDGFVVARHLVMRRVDTRVLLFAAPEEVKGDALTNLQILQKSGVAVEVFTGPDVTEASLKSVFDGLQADIAVDGLLGTGIRPPVEGLLATVIGTLQQHPCIVAIDIPSGLDCDDCTPSRRTAATAELTVTFTAPKPAHVFSSSDGAVQRWVVIPIGSPTALVDDSRHWLNVFTEADAIQALRRFHRPSDTHKGTYGHALVVAGSVGKSGAAVMTAKSALLAGSGLVTAATPAPCLPVIASQAAEVMTEPLEATEQGSISTQAFDYGKIDRILGGKDLLAIGPGLGTHPETVEFVRRLLRETRIPVVLDADGLNAFAGRDELLSGNDRVVVLTPHPGEFARLLKRSVEEVLSDRVNLAKKYAEARRVHLVLKGHRTIYASPSGQVFVNSTGNPGMATGGAGDVLTGILTGLIGQEICRPENPASVSSMEQAVALGVYLHGLAGDLARETRGEQSLVASDLMDHLPGAFLKLAKLVALSAGHAALKKSSH